MKAVIVGAGHRGAIYAQYAEFHPQVMQITALVEPCPDVREAFAARYGLADDRVFASFDSFIAAPRMADAVIISTPDALHFSQTMASLEAFYNVLLEKPIAQSYAECLQIQALAHKMALMVGVCFPLRYHPVCQRTKELVRQGAIGRLVSINHTEYIGVERMIHNFVRGACSRVASSGPLLLTKSCHDLDYIVALSNARCRTAYSVGSLSWFRAENAPQGSAFRCIDCSVEGECPFSAVEIYRRRGHWLRHFRDTTPGGIERELAGGPYGRCVYHADNDVWDNQVLAMEMENGVSVSFSLNALTTLDKRRTHLMGSEGEILVDENFDHLFLRRFIDHSEEVFDFGDLSDKGHAGADWQLVEHFIEAFHDGSYSDLEISIDRAIESHRIAFL
ncbi:MAG: Gfo/Idh/MocA family oxidoreductase [Mucinivorans sp.]